MNREQLKVVTFYSPRPGHEKMQDYLPCLDLQRKTAQKFGHSHLVISDRKVADFDCHETELPLNLMLAILTGQISFLRSWDDSYPVVLADADVLVGRDLTRAFDGSFDIAFTNREDPKVPINNGVVYIAMGGRDAALSIYENALTHCHKLWGGDQEALCTALAPVPNYHGVLQRGEHRIGFFNMRTHNCVPRQEGMKHLSHPFAIHFKGMERKAWMRTYAERFIL